MRAMRGATGRVLEHVFRRRPALPLAILLITGIAVGRLLPPWPVAWMIAGAAAAAAAIVLRRRSAVATVLLLAAIFFVGAALVQLESHSFPRGAIASFTTEEPRLAQVELRITTPPRGLAAASQARPLPSKQTARAQVVRIKTIRGWEEASGAIALTVEQPHPRLACGQLIRATGQLQRPAAAMNPGQFDWAAYYRGQRILATFSVPHADALTILSDNGAPWHEAMRIAARNLLAAGFTSDRAPQHALLKALVLGDRDAEARQAAEDFARSGAAHLLAVSGLHVMLVAGFVLLTCRLLRLHPRTATYAMLAAVVVYALIVVPGAPALRATVLCAAFAASRLTRRTRDGVNILALCAVGLLIYWPNDLFNAGFQLSFGTVFGMLACGPRIMERVVAWYDGDEHTRVARSFRPPGFWGRTWLRVRAHLWSATAIGVLAWLISMPLVMYHFDQVNPFAVLAGIVLLPLVALGLGAGLLKIVMTLLLPSLAPVWAGMAGKTMGALMWIVGGFAHLPGADVAVPVPPGWFFVVFYLLVLLPMVRWGLSSARLRRCLRCGPVAALALVPIFGRAPADETRVTLLAIGAGQIAVVELPDGRTYLIDDGSSSIADPLPTVLGPYLRTRGRARIEAIFLSHPDYDHISAAAGTAEEMHAAVVYVSPVFRRQSQENEPAEQMLRRLDDEGVPIEVLARGRRMELGAGTAIEVLWPPAGRAFRSTNNAGMVLRLACPGGHAILFPADIQVATERELTERPEGLASEVLVAPHHGSAETTTGSFVRAVAPRLIVSSNDRRLSRKQREFDRLMATAGDALYRTSRCGAITIAISKGGEMRVETFLASGNAHGVERSQK